MVIGAELMIKLNAMPAASILAVVKSSCGGSKKPAGMFNYRARCMDITVTRFTVWTRKISTIAPESLKEDPYYRLITAVSHVWSNVSCVGA